MQDAWGDEKCIQNINGKPQGKRQLERRRHKWNGDIRKYLRDTERDKCGNVFKLSQVRFQWRTL